MEVWSPVSLPRDLDQQPVTDAALGLTARSPIAASKFGSWHSFPPEIFDCKTVQKRNRCQYISVGLDLHVVPGEDLLEKSTQRKGCKAPIIRTDVHVAAANLLDAGRGDQHAAAGLQNAVQRLDCGAKIVNQQENLRVLWLH